MCVRRWGRLIVRVLAQSGVSVCERRGRLIVRVMAQSGVSVCEEVGEAHSQGVGTEWGKCV